MSLIDGGPETVVLVQAARVTDRRGDEALDWADATRTTLPAVHVQQAGTTEATDTKQAVVTRWNLYGRAEPARSRDRIEWRELVLEVDGDPNHVRDIAGAYHHTEARLVLLTGGE